MTADEAATREYVRTYLRQKHSEADGRPLTDERLDLLLSAHDGTIAAAAKHWRNGESQALIAALEIALAAGLSGTIIL
jgi:hypothetical protein